MFDGSVDPGASLPGVNIYQSLSEENLVQGTEGEEREELKVVKSEGEESEEEGNVEKRLKEMQALVTGHQSCSSSVTPHRPDSLAGIFSITTLTLAISYVL